MIPTSNQAIPTERFFIAAGYDRLPMFAQRAPTSSEYIDSNSVDAPYFLPNVDAGLIAEVLIGCGVLDGNPRTCSPQHSGER